MLPTAPYAENACHLDVTKSDAHRGCRKGAIRRLDQGAAASAARGIRCGAAVAGHDDIVVVHIRR